MRSLLASLTILAVGILAALPFRKKADSEIEVPVLEDSQLASLVSPLEENRSPSTDSDSWTIQELAAPSYVAAPSEPEPMQPDWQPLPTTRRPFGQSIVKPQPVLPDPNSLALAGNYDITARDRDWDLDLPLKYTRPQTGLMPAPVAKPDAPMTTIAQSHGSSGAPLASTQMHQPSFGAVDDPGSMQLQSAGSRHAFNSHPSMGMLDDPSPYSPPPPDPARPDAPPGPRKRHYIYEPSR